MNVDPSLNPSVNLSYNQGRVELAKTEQPQPTENKGEVGAVTFKDQSREERSVKAKTFHSWNLLHRLEIGMKKSILVNLNGTPVLINVGSIKKRTGLSGDQIFRSLQLVQDITRALAQKCLLNQRANPASQPPIREPQTPPTTPSSRTALTTTPASPPSISELHTHPTTSSSPMALANRPTKLGKGTYGKAVSIITEVDRVVAKYARKRAGLEGARDVEREYANHERLFQGQSVYGTQIPYHNRTLIQFPEKHGPGTRGVIANIGHEYNEGDYYSTIARGPASFEKSAATFHQIFHTLHFMEQRGVTHEDIKGENIFLDRVGTGLAADLCDLASLQFNGDPIPAHISGTPSYTASTDLKLLETLIYRRTPRIRGADGEEYLNCSERTYNTIRELKAKRDVFAAGATMYAALTGILPYNLNSDDFAVPTPYRDIPDVPPEFNALLRQMLNFSAVDRIGRTEAWNEYNRILDQYPAFKRRVEANISAIGRAPPPIA